jgi:ATP-dependent Clp protease protease subunit
MRNSFHSVRKSNIRNTSKSKYRLTSDDSQGVVAAAAAEAVSQIFSQEQPQGSPFRKDPDGIEVDENKIYFYTDVGESQALELNKIIRHLDLEMEFLARRLGLAEPPPIKIFIHSPGGSFFSALSIVDTIKSCKSPIHTYIDGFAASAATMISVVAKRRFATRNSFMLIHQQRMMWEGKHADFIDEIENQKHVTDTIRKIYLDHTNMKAKELDSILKRELHMPSEECLRLGLIDEII